MKPQTESKTSRQETLRYWLALLQTPGIGSSRFTAMLEQFESVQSVFSSSVNDLQQAGLSKKTITALQQPDWQQVDNALAWAQGTANHIVLRSDPVYPHLLTEIDSPPPLLFVHGNVDILNNLQLAIVGSRNPTQGGKDTAKSFSYYLANQGLTITSGLALGIDAIAHQGALDAKGPTIAVMGTGLDRVYPARNRDLAHKIADTGALISEFPPGTPPLPANFPRRNRIISGMSLGVLVVEAAKQSGSLITARTAMEQGREVFAIPGSIHNPLSRGCHAIIRQGAKLVETGEHILEELGALALHSLTQEEIPLVNNSSSNLSEQEDYQKLLECMGYDPVTIDELITRSGLTSDHLSSMLLLLELDGYITPVHGVGYCRSEKRI
ncbi:MAG: DNA-processing protein DprA [Gammaproteobacteria bacterium]